MSNRIARIFLTFGLLGFAISANAALIAYTSGGVAVVYDDDRDLTWVANANLFKTQYDDDDNVVNQIINDIGTVSDGLGTHTLDANDFLYASDGLMTWYGAMAWAEWLGLQGYGGANDWRLWSALDSDGSEPCTNSGNSPFECDSELGHLFYLEGNLDAGNSILADPPGILGQYFTTMQDFKYWSGTELSSSAWSAWGFWTNEGSQYWFAKVNSQYGWAVRSGKIGAAPSPATSLLLVLGFTLLAIGFRTEQRSRALSMNS